VLAGREEVEKAALHAAVAILVHESPAAGPELLFIQRAEREGDPWSGHMAFPGGRRDPADSDLASTAARETLEEVGVELTRPIGRLDDFAGSGNPRVPPLVVSAYVYEAAERPRIVANHEVHSTVWIPLEWILQARSVVQHTIEREGQSAAFSAVRYQGYTVWGLTYRILGNFLGVLGSSLPEFDEAGVRPGSAPRG